MNWNTPRLRKRAVLSLVIILIVSAACQAGPTPEPASTRSNTAAAATQAPTARPTAAAVATRAAATTRTPATEAATAAPVKAATNKPEPTNPAAAQPEAGTAITLEGNSIRTSGPGVSVDGSTVTITQPGAYRISGALQDGQVAVDSPDKGAVNLILDGVDIRNNDGAAINVVDADTVVITLADGSQNVVTDGANYVFPDPAVDEPNAAIFSTADTTINGSGSLAVSGNFNDAIASKDGLTIESGVITVKAADDGIRGKDYLEIKNASLDVTAQGDGLKSDNAEDAARGYIAIDAGVIKVNTGGDAIDAQTNVTIRGGEFTLSAGGGSGGQIDDATSAKGIKGDVAVVIEGGTFTIDTADDAVHSNVAVTVNGGVFQIATGDDAMHADAALTVNDGQINITRSYEGLESSILVINGGNINLVSSDDGLNVAGGNDGSGAAAPMGRGQDRFRSNPGEYLHINGGRIVVNSSGDGIDINGSVEMTDGVLIVHGTTQNMNAALDYDGSFKITGGFVVGVGSVGMAEAPDESSSQLSFLLNFDGQIPAGTLVHIESADGQDILTFQPEKNFQSIAFSSPDLKQGATYVVYGQGSATGTAQDGLYEASAYEPGQEVGRFTLSGITTYIGSRGRGGRP